MADAAPSAASLDRLEAAMASLASMDSVLHGTHLRLDAFHASMLFKLDLISQQLDSMIFRQRSPRLDISNNQLTGEIPKRIGLLHELEYLSLEENYLEGDITESHLTNLSKLKVLGITDNSLSLKFGTIPNLPIKLHTKSYGTSIILNSNQFEGRIPNFLSQAWTLDLSENKISDINSFLCGKNATTYLYTLDLSNNEIMGQLPDYWDDLNSLEYLDLSNNKLSGKIPQSMGTLVYLQALVLRNNSLIGELAFMLKNCTHLDILDVSQNLLSGQIPSWIGESQDYEFWNPEYILKSIDLSSNDLSAEIPKEVGYLFGLVSLNLA
uniref:Uncharacterized protein n=1 Tax=Glycine max TaxID=3847 RepID=A0A0R0G0L4_SOYBN